MIDSTGVKAYIIKGISYETVKARGIQDKRLMKGYIRYSDRISKNINNKQESRNADFSWFNQLWFTKNYSLLSNFQYRNSFDDKNWHLDDYYLRFSKDYREGNQYYLHYGSFSELIDRPYGFLADNYRGLIFSYNALSWVDALVWTGKLKNSDGPNAYGGNIDFKYLKLGYATNDIKKIYNANTSFNLTNYLSTSTSVSTDGNTYILSNEENLYLPKEYQFLGLQTITYGLGYVPEYSFGLSQHLNGERVEHKIQAQFANQDMIKDVDQNELELIPGMLSTSISYNFAKFDLYQGDYYSVNTVYNTDYLFTGLLGAYERSYLLTDKTDNLFIKPYIELFFLGQAGRGWSIRNSHLFSYKTVYTTLDEQHLNQQNSTIGLYYTQPGYRYGVFAGSGQDNVDVNNNISGSSTNLYGADIYVKRKKIGYNLNYTHTLVKNTGFNADTVRAAMHYYTREHQLGLTASYRRSQSSLVNEDLFGSLSYTYNYDIGNFTLSEKIDNVRTSIIGRVCVDKNFNSRCDDNEEIVEGMKISLSRDPQVETKILSSEGSFSFSNLAPRVYFLSLENMPANYQTFKSLVMDLGAGAGEYKIDIPVMETEYLKIRPIFKGQYMPYIPVSVNCGNGLIFTKAEIMTDYLAVLKPKGLKCEENLDFSSFDENVFISEMISKNGIKEYHLESSYKQIRGVVLFGEKPTKTSVFMNQTKLDTEKNGSFIVIVDGKDPMFRFSKPGYECRTSPNYDLLYAQIQKYANVTIRCNKLNPQKD